MVIITNFQAPKEIEDLIYRYENNDKLTSLDILIHVVLNEGETEWTVSKDSMPGDIVLFMCAKTSIDHISRLFNEAKRLGNEDFTIYAEEQREAYRKYAGKILAIGRLEGIPFYSESDYPYQGWKSPWYGKIVDLIWLENAISIDKFRDFIKISRTGAITKLNNDQWQILSEIIVKHGNDISSFV
jgi:hypothetical protein